MTNPINAYSYSPVTFELVSIITADPDQENPGEYLVPAYATLVEPDSAGEHEVAVFDPNEETWSLEPDWRGVPLYLTATGALTTITAIGDEPEDISAVETAPSGPAGATEWTWDAGEEEWVETLGSAKLRGVALVNAAYDIAADAWVPDGDETYSYHTTEIITLQKARTGTGNVTVTQKTFVGGATASVSVNDAAFKVITVSIKDFLDDLITRFNGYLDGIAAASTIEAVDLILGNL